MDIFGYFISFNFNQEGDHHKTRVGGLMTILLRAFMLAYIVRISKKMLFYEEDLVENKIIKLNDDNKAEWKTTYF